MPYAVADGQYRTYTVDLSNHAYWNGTITGFRFDAPTGSTGKVFYLDYISAGNMVFIDNGTVRVGVRMDWGAAITEFGYNTTNLINNTDTGRLMQVALRSGDDSYYPDDPMDDRNGWNPNQGGDKYNTGSPVVDYSIGNGTIYTKTRSYEWNPDNKGGGDGSPVLSDVYVEQWVSFETNLMVKVDYKVTYLGTVPRSLHNQEFPCIFASGTFTDFWSYVGTSPWTGAALTQQTAMPVTWFTSEYWATAANAGGFGVTLYTPQEYRSPRFYCNNLPDARIAPCNYFVSNPIFAIMPDGIYETTVYMICGNVATARGQITNYLRPYETVTTEWHFSTDDYAEGWYAAHDMDLDEFSVSGGYMSCETSNTDPYFAYSWAADCLASSYSEIEIRMNEVTSGTVGQIYFTTIADQTWDASKRKTFTVTPGAELLHLHNRHEHGRWMVGSHQRIQDRPHNLQRCHSLDRLHQTQTVNRLEISLFKTKAAPNPGAAFFCDVGAISPPPSPQACRKQPDARVPS